MRRRHASFDIVRQRVSRRHVNRLLCALATALVSEGAPAQQDRVAERVKKIVVEQFGVDSKKVTPEARFIGDLGADSLDCVELTMKFEEEFHIAIPDEEANRFVTVGDAIRHIQKRPPLPARSKSK